MTKKKTDKNALNTALDAIEKVGQDKPKPRLLEESILALAGRRRGARKSGDALLDWTRSMALSPQSYNLMVKTLVAEGWADAEAREALSAHLRTFRSEHDLKARGGAQTDSSPGERKHLWVRVTDEAAGAWFEGMSAQERGEAISRAYKALNPA